MVSAPQSVPIWGRRCLAWGLEIAVLAASVITPWYLGHQVNQRADVRQVQVTPAIRLAHGVAARTLGLSPRSLPTTVPPLTNVLWSAALGGPLLLATAHLYGLGRHGCSWPKRWLRIQVLALNGQMPGWRRSLMREGLGKWGGPFMVAYGLWQVSGAFPSGVILAALGILALAAESLTSLGNRPRRAWHDWLAGTCVVDQETGAILRLANLWEDDSAAANDSRRHSLAWPDPNGGLTSVILPPERSVAAALPWRAWGLGVCLLFLAGLAGAGSYGLLRRTPTAEADKALYRDLVVTLTRPDLDVSARQSTVLALAHLSDERVTPLLVDLLLQTQEPGQLATLQRAITARGAAAVPELRRLNRSLAAELTQPATAAAPAPVLSLQIVNQTLTKVLLLDERDRTTTLDLSHLHLGHLVSPQGDFTLILTRQDLSGTQWQGSLMNRANLAGSQFYQVGADGHPNTYDDRTSDFSGADLTDATLSEADLSLARFVGSGLLRANLTRATLVLADLSRANLEQAQLIQANLTRAQLTGTRLAEADLTEATLLGADLTAARLVEVTAAGADLATARLARVSAPAANFTDANLSRAQLMRADLSSARLVRADLRQADLRQATLRDADLRGARLQGARLDGADLAGALLTPPQATTDSSFVEALPDHPPGNQLAGVDFSRVRNLAPEQLTFICTQGGIHPACQPSEQE